MKVHLVRHARTTKRSSVGDASAKAPERLSAAGLEQARGLVGQLEDSRSLRLVAAPTLACRETLGPLSRATGRAIEIDDRLHESVSQVDLVALMADLAERPTVVCSQAGSIRRLLTEYGVAGTVSPSGTPCRKGSVWTIEGFGRSSSERATYYAPVTGADGRARPLDLEREIAWPKTLRAAVIDLGSTSFTLLVADVTRQGAISPILRKKVMLRLGTAIAHHGKLPSAIVREAVETARSMCEVAKREKAQLIRAVATASLRDASNGRKVGAKIAEAIGQPVDILEGQTEARLMFRAFQQRLSIGEEPVLGLDLGGGSLEVAAGCGRRIDHEVTLGLGVVRLASEIVTSDPMRRREARQIRERVERELAPHLEQLLLRAPGRLIVAGGTPRAIARLVAARRGGARRGGAESLPMELDREALRNVSRRLARSSHAQRLDMPGIRRRRADLVATGAVILESVADLLDLERFTFCDWGLREGVLLERMEAARPRLIRSR